MSYHYNESSNPIINFLQGSVVKKLVLINVLVFIMQLALLRTPFEYFFALYPRNVVTRGYVWQIITYMFLHGDLFHILFNMIIIWIFGIQLERVWGSDRFLKYYFICGIGGAVGSFIFSFNTAVIGASGAGFGILLAYAILFPHNLIYIWGIFPVRARVLVIALFIIELIRGFQGGSGIAHFAHLGGMAAGYLYLKSDYRAWRFKERIRRLFDGLPIKVKLDRDADDDEEEWDGEDEESKINSILDKISSKGYENLTETERRILENYSRRQERD